MAELSTDKVLEATRKVLCKQERDSLPSITPRMIRSLVEDELGLDSGDLLSHKEVIKMAAQDYINGQDELAVGVSAKDKDTKIAPRKQQSKKRRSRKGNSSDEDEPQKKRKRISKKVKGDVQTNLDEPLPLSEVKSDQSRIPKAKVTPTEKAFGQFLDIIGSEMMREIQKTVDSDDEQVHAPKSGIITEFDSDLSSVIDETPVKRRKQKSQESKSTKSREKKVVVSLDRNEEEIKRLKSFIVACGVRKAWSKEFKGLDKSSQQIAHLKKLLADLGMTGRLSMEKAKRIRAQRELQQETQDAIEFDRKRGSGAQSSQVPEARQASDYDDDDEVVKPARNKLQKSITAFLADQSDEE